MIVALILATAQGLSAAEQRVRDAVQSQRADAIAYLQRQVDIPSSTLNFAGVRRVGEMYRASLDSLGFTTRWSDQSAQGRAGHLIAERRGRTGAVRMLLIGHFDTVVEPGGPSWRVQDSTRALGIGASDMKGGNVIALYALKALHAAGALDGLNVTVVMTGDEEDAGSPLAEARADLIAAARNSDVALAFEGGNRGDATVARRGSSNWKLFVTGRQAHSSGVFGQGSGYGAIYEIARIIDAIRRELSSEQYLTINVATIVGGTDVTYDSVTNRGTAESRLNIIPRSAIAYGDLRFLTEEQKERARARMRAIVAQHLPQTGAEIHFEDRYPGMAPTPGNGRLLAIYDGASRALGHGAVTAIDPGRRGAGDISFVAPIIDGLDGLGALGSGAHAPGESVHLPSLVMQTERAAILLLRLGLMSATDFRRRTVQ